MPGQCLPQVRASPVGDDGQDQSGQCHCYQKNPCGARVEASENSRRGHGQAKGYQDRRQDPDVEIVEGVDVGYDAIENIP